MRIAVVGAGAMGGSYGGMLARAGEDVALLDARSDHIAAIRAGGLRVSGAFGEHVVRVSAAESPEGLEPADGGWADLAIVFTDTNATREAARAAGHLLAPEGCAITFQNGIGNVEMLQEELGAARVLGGSSMCSALVEAPGHVVMTHRGPTSVGELDGRRTNRLQRVVGALERAGFEVLVKDDINARIWTKFIINSAVNALCATTGLRVGEISRLAEMDALQDRVLDEAFALVRAKEIAIEEADVRAGDQAQLPPQVQPTLDAPARGGRPSDRDRRDQRRARSRVAQARPRRALQRGPHRAPQGPRARRHPAPGGTGSGLRRVGGGSGGRGEAFDRLTSSAIVDPGAGRPSPSRPACHGVREARRFRLARRGASHVIKPVDGGR